MRPGFVRTLVLWVVLIVLFVAFYNFFQTHPSGGEEVSSSPPARWLPWGLLVVLGGLFFFFYWQQVGLNKLSNRGVQLMSSGRYSEALKVFEEVRGKAKKSPLGPHNVGAARFSLWQLEQACVEFEAAAKLVSTSALWKAFRAQMADLHAVTLALLGKVDAAKVVHAGRDREAAEGGMVVLMQAIVACRGGDFAAGRALLDRFEVKQLGGMSGALAAALRAWSLERTTGELRHVDKVALFGETGAETLRTVWPELAAFVERAPSA